MQQTAAEIPILTQEPITFERPTGVISVLRNVGRFCRRKPMGAIGGVIVLTMLFAALFVDAKVITAGASNEPLLAPSGYNEQHIRRAEINQGPSLAHPMGTDELGRDIFSRILYGARISAVIGYSSVAIIVVVSLLLGTFSGYFSGWVDTLTQRLIDIVLSIPPIVLLIFSLSVFAGRSGPYVRMFWIIVIVGVIVSAQSVRVVRGAAIAVSNNQYIDAARTIGASNARIILRHIIPNVVPVAIVLATVNLGTAILAEAAISFLGYGIPPPFPSWGGMLNLSGSSQFRAEPLQALWPGLAIALSVFGFNMLGDALRDVLDPRLRGGR
jgi:peptide/nickel transport system permease protein